MYLSTERVQHQLLCTEAGHIAPLQAVNGLTELHAEHLR